MGPNMAESEIFKPPYLPQMGADSHHSKTIFIRAPRAITLMSQIRGLAPPSGWTRKVGVAPKISNPNFSKTSRQNFSKIFVWEGHMNPHRFANFKEKRNSRKISGRNFRKFRWGALTPKLHGISRLGLACLWGASLLVLWYLTSRSRPSRFREIRGRTKTFGAT